ncbi:hypothetical protein RND71_005460 [Anisodus tanguticus]|uniref:Uncharacterized protein n=1 Tax=Anisodus tanguticus TaxID=243964 RepID=A0AAE1VLI3_9SOLA|nr:hypothetical protein RND71_005460 [Anisodus tanguticus]
MDQNLPDSPSCLLYVEKRVIKEKINDDDVLMMNAAVLKALEMLQSETSSPALPGYGRTPTVRQLRVTDSPFPLRDADVDEKADEFISRFYRDFRREASAFA